MTTEPVSIGSRVGLDKITITALLAGAVNLIGGAAAVKGWLLDLGLRYYDALSIGFGLPSGSFIPDDKRLIATGYSVVLNSSAGIGVIVFIAPTMFVYLALGYAYARIIWERRRPISAGANSWWEVDDTVSKLLLGVVALLIVSSLSYGLYQAVYKVPLNAAAEGESVASNIVGQIVKDPKCTKCLVYGQKGIVGLPVFTDGKSIVVATADGGVTRIPTDDLSVKLRPAK